MQIQFIQLPLKRSYVTIKDHIYVVGSSLGVGLIWFQDFGTLWIVTSGIFQIRLHLRTLFLNVKNIILSSLKKCLSTCEILTKFKWKSYTLLLALGIGALYWTRASIRFLARELISLPYWLKAPTTVFSLHHSTCLSNAFWLKLRLQWGQTFNGFTARRREFISLLGASIFVLGNVVIREETVVFLTLGGWATSSWESWEALCWEDLKTWRFFGSFTHIFTCFIRDVGLKVRSQFGHRCSSIWSTSGIDTVAAFIVPIKVNKKLGK